VRPSSDPTSVSTISATSALPPLSLLKALGDDTRYAIHRHLVEADRPLTIAEISDAIGLHVNTVRPHLERMRDVGLVEVSVEVSADVDGGSRRVGRPRHRYSATAPSPALGLEPQAMPTLAGLVLTLADRLGASADDVEAVGRDEGRRRCTSFASSRSSVALVADQDRLGFEPAARDAPGGDTVVTFNRCPFGELAEQHPDLVCGLHRGLIDGFVSGLGDTRLTDFHPLSDRAPCRATLR
jgi:predicted ArsR family transcriptional regulator